MALYTVIADYRGGTYIKQLHASSVRSALEQWARELPDIRGSFIGAATKRKVSAAVGEPDDTPVTIEGTENVWFWSSCGFEVHLVKTEAAKA
jgi:hypothetical protein